MTRATPYPTRLRRSPSPLLLWVLGLLTLCSATNASAQEWDPYEYADLVQTASELQRQAAELPPEQAAQRREILIESLDSNHRSLIMLRNAIRDGIIDQYGAQYRDQASADLLVGYRQYLRLLVDVQLCTAAQMELDTMLGDLRILPEGAEAELNSIGSEINGCTEHSGAVAEGGSNTTPQPPEGQPEDTHDTPPDPSPGSDPDPLAVADPEPGTETSSTSNDDRHSSQRPDGHVRVDDRVLGHSNSRAIWSWSLIGAGGAMLASALIVDMVLAGDRDEFDSIQSECDELGVCDGARLLDLESSINDGKIVIGTLLGAGVVSATVGVVLLVTGRRSENLLLGLAPYVEPGGMGVSWGMRF